jgi:hypothetical protein
LITLYPSQISTQSISVMEEDMWSKAIDNITIVSIGLFLLFILVLISSLQKANSYLTPLVVISEYSKKKADQTANPNESNKEIEPIKLIDVKNFKFNLNLYKGARSSW